MKKTKIGQRFENAVNAFFDNENLVEDNALSFSDNANLFHEETTKSTGEKAGILLKIFRQLFLFLPGAFTLFFLSLGYTGFFLLRPQLGRNHHLFIGLLFLAVSVLFTVLGLGDLRKPKHFLLPLSIIIFSVILGVIGSFTYGLTGFKYFIDTYAVMLFPLALIIPVLVKGSIDKMNKHSD